MQGGVFRIVLLFALCVLLLQFVLAEPCNAGCDYCVNTCDAEHSTRMGVASLELLDYYRGFVPTFQDPGKSLSVVYPAALFYFSQPGLEAQANTFLELELALDQPLSPSSAVYLAWIEKKHGAELTGSLPADIDAKLDAFVAAGHDSFPYYEHKFLYRVARQLHEGSASQLVGNLQSGGVNGWPGNIEQAPLRLRNVTIGLFALYDQADDPYLRKLAEMNLDLVFTRFAAASAGGAWVSATSGNMIDNHVYEVEGSPWFGWSYLLLGTDPAMNDLAMSEPSAFLSEYCAHGVTTGFKEYQRRVLETTTQGGKLATYATDKYAIGAAQHVGVDFTAYEGYKTKGMVRFGDEPNAFIELSTRTSDDSDDADKGDDADIVLLNERVMLGHLGGGVCREPHAFFGEGFEFSPIADDSGVYVGAAFAYGGETFGVLHFFDGIASAPVYQRYALRANKLPVWLTAEVIDTDGDGIPDEATGSGNGLVIFPAMSASERGVFALEILSESDVLAAVDGCDVLGFSDLQCVAIAAILETSLDYSGGEISYTSTFGPGGAAQTYTYTPGGQAQIQGQPLSFADYSLRHVMRLGVQNDMLVQTGQIWTYDGNYPGGNAVVTLDFSQSDHMVMKRQAGDPESYTCEEDGDTLPGSPSGDFSRLGFAAAAFRQHLEGDDHVIDCGPGTTVMPNALTGPDYVEGACVIESEGHRTVAFVYDPGDASAFLETIILTYIGLYYPFQDVTTLNLDQLDAELCNSADGQTEDNTDFASCGHLTVKDGGEGLQSISKIYLYTNGMNNILVLSDDTNPFTAGWWDNGIGDWWDALFGDGTVEGPDPEQVRAFHAAYFYDDGDVSVSAMLDDNGAGEVIAKNLVESLEPLASQNGVTYAAGGTTQVLTFGSPNAAVDSTWGMLTRTLRIDKDYPGSPLNVPAMCGGTQISHIPECDPPNTDLYDCTEGDTSASVVCDSQCRIDTSACFHTDDLDNDGEDGDGCGLPECDCLDADPIGYLVLNLEGDGYVPCDDVVPLGPQCDEAPYSRCPQCVRHSDPDNGIYVSDPCDGVNNDCEPPTDPGDCEGEPGGETPPIFSCDTEPPGGGGGLVSDFGLSCQEPNVRVGSTGVYTVRELYSPSGEHPYADAGDRMINFQSPSSDSDCYLFGHSNQWHIRSNPHEHYFLDTTRYTDLGGRPVTIPWPQYTIWSSTPGATSGTYRPPTGDILVKLRRQVALGSLTWNLQASFLSPSQTELARFVDCWYDGNVDDLKVGGQFNQGLVEAWADTALPAIGDEMVTPCENEPQGGGEGPCGYVCELPEPECPLTCDSSNCQECESHHLCTPHPSCSGGSGDCGYLDPCDHTWDCDPEFYCNHLGCCMFHFDCFTAGTMILTPGGEQSIEALVVGDEVVSYDVDTGERAVSTVVGLYESGDENVVLNINDRITVTPKHPFYTSDGWAEAGELALGADLLTEAGEWETVTSIVAQENDEPVYNLQVEPTNTYYAEGVLVHNKQIFYP